MARSLLFSSRTRVSPLALPDLSAWQALISHRPPAQVQQEIQDREDTDYFQAIEDGVGPVNLDYYPVRIIRLPVLGGRTLTPEALLGHVRRHFNDFLDETLAFFEPYSKADGSRWRSTDPLGAVLHIDMNLGLGLLGGLDNPDDGSVVVTDARPHRWIVSTVNTSDDFSHPLNGNREWGFVRKSHHVVFYTRGADRLASFLDQIANVGMEDVTFNMADRLWTSFQRKLAAFVNNLEGQAEVGTSTNERHDWEAVKAAYHHPRIGWSSGAQSSAPLSQARGAVTSSSGSSANRLRLMEQEVYGRAWS